MKNVLLVFVTLFYACASAHAQITIGGSVYGGGNHGNTGGKSTVSVYGGDIHEVFGGARMADVAGSAFVNIDGENADGYILIDKVYGGNDISGTIGTSTSIPEELTQTTENGINNTWNAFVRLSTKMVTTGEGSEAVTTAAPDAPKVYIGQLFGGGNGDYTYSAVKGNGKYDVTLDDGETVVQDIVKPEIAKTYLEVLGGTIAYAYGGGNNVTITEKTVINVDNPSEVVTSIEDTRTTSVDEGELITPDRERDRMGINLAYSYYTSSDFQIGRFFGGNNKAEMAIRPTWNLKSGKIRNLYSGGNKGKMTSLEGLLLEIPATSTIKVDNLYGGCRMADVMPSVNGVYTPVDNLPGYKFPKELSARVLVRGGDVNNVYGGNDVTGRVYGGSAVGIYTTVRGDVYGGGNGSYAYTDNESLKNSEAYGDLYYDPSTAGSSIEALNNYRPNAEQVSIRLYSPDADKPTIIGGSVYCGGNSATLKTTKANPMVELKIGSNVIANNVFLGNNGANMIKYNAKDKDEAGEDDEGAAEGVLYTMRRADIAELEGTGTTFSSLDLTNTDQFAAYMQGAAMPLMPNVVFDSKANGDPDDYEPYSSYIGSFYLGGNVGSMTAPGTFYTDELNSVIIYDKLVGGCNDAVVEQTPYNAYHEGGLTAEAHPKVQMTLKGLQLEPRRLVRDDEDRPTHLEWNTSGEDNARRLIGANVYGGCYESGYVNGDVVINIEASTVDRDKVFGTGEGKSGVTLDKQRDDVYANALNIFGGGYGEKSEVWGSATINHTAGYTFQIFGGGDQGVIGKKDAEDNYVYNPAYSTTVNLNGSEAATADNDVAEVESIYGGGFKGLVTGDTHVNLGNGRVGETFGGACVADVLGHTETIIGKDGFP